MTDDPIGQSDADASRRLLEQSERTLRELLDAVGAMTSRTRAGEALKDTDIAIAILSLANTRTMVIQEIQKYDKRGQLSGGDPTDGSHDFDAIRGLLGRQLDRIRKARGADGVLE